MLVTRVFWKVFGSNHNVALSIMKDINTKDKSMAEAKAKKKKLKDLYDEADKK